MAASPLKKPALTPPTSDTFTLAGKTFSSRLLVGTGKYASLEQTAAAIRASGAEIITVAVRRMNLSTAGEASLLDVLSPKEFTYLPNSAGCHSAEEALRTLRLARELGGWDMVKLEVIGDKQTLYPDMLETIRATELLTKEGFHVMAYTTDDPVMVRRVEEAGAIAVMPLAAPIGSGLGIQNPIHIQQIVQQSNVPVLVDAGVGTASDAAIAMELGCDGVLMNTAIAKAQNPVLMAEAMKHAVAAGRMAFRAERMPKRTHADASSPNTGII